MIDLHHHLLFGLDDGAPDLDTSLAMVEMALADGITHIVCTPHANYRYAFSPEKNAERLAMIQELVGEKITLGLGCDFHLSYENIQDVMVRPSRYTINGKQYLLVEFPDFGIPQNITQSFYQMMQAGTVPVLTHPERNPTLAAQPERMTEWLRMGCLVQVTAGSLTGNFGRSAQRFAERMVGDRWVHLLATDAHNTTSRPPRMRPAYEWLERNHGHAEAERLCVTNPLAVFLGKALPEQPAPVGVFEEGNPRSRQGFWRSIFSGKK
jgi:protein-tyrosine phosphatase